MPASIIPGAADIDTTWIRTPSGWTTISGPCDCGPIIKEINEYMSSTNIIINPRLANDTDVSSFTIVNRLELIYYYSYLIPITSPNSFLAADPKTLADFSGDT